MKTFLDLDDTPCPTCGRVNNAMSNPQAEQPPKPGDMTVCIECQGIHVFNESMQLRFPTESELARVSLSDLCRIQAAITNAKKQCDDKEKIEA